MKIKTDDLIGPALDWAVTSIEYPRLKERDTEGDVYYIDYSKEWESAGPIIEREYISVCAHLVGKWNAYLPNEKASLEFLRSGPTPLIAAMRYYVASKLGDEIEVPEEIL